MSYRPGESTGITAPQYPGGVVGHCTRCGMPIMLDPGPYWSVLPPPPRRTCGCFAEDVVSTDTTNAYAFMVSIRGPV